MHALRCMVHIGIGFARRVVPVIVLARPRQRRKLAMHGIVQLRLRWPIRGIKWQWRRPRERRAHQRDRAKHVRPHQRAPGGDSTAKIMPDHRIDRAVAERRHQAERVAHQIEQPERGKVAIIARVPTGGAAIAALVGRDHVIAGFRQRRHHLAPTKGKFGKAMQQQHARPPACFIAGFEHMHAQAVNVFHEQRADTGGMGNRGEGCHDELASGEWRVANR